MTYDKAKRHGTVRSALVVAEIILNGTAVYGTTNKRGRGRVSRWTQHAEERAAKRARYYIRKGQVGILVKRYRRDGSVGMAKPCFRCEQILRRLGISYVFYTNASGAVEKLF